MAWPLKSLVVFAALPIFSIVAATYYYYFIKDKEWEECIQNVSRKEVELKIPLSCVGSLIGRAGTNIREFQDKTKTKINFKNIEGEENYKICRIVGDEENVDAAKNMILEFIDPKGAETVEMWVPQSACGLIIGRCGDTIRQISLSTNTKITIDKHKVALNKKLLVIKGKSENVTVAKQLIENKIKEDENKRRELTTTNLGRSPRMRAKNRKGNDTENVKKIPKCERLVSESRDSMIQVYVSSVSSPSHFWLQVITPRAVQLDQLVENMSEYYNIEENRALHKLKEVKEGQIVVCRFEHDNKWYRVEVFSVEVNETDIDESNVDVFYVDYGDSAYYRMGDLFELRSDFLNLKFQAIEVSMAGIEPKDGKEDWEEAAIDSFIDMVYSAQWKVMLAQVIGYKEKTHTTRSGLIPSIRLYDPDGPVGVDIGKLLIEKGYARAVETEEPMTADNDDNWN